jgi:cysteate synthase
LKQRELVNISADVGKKQIQQIVADVLSNRQPPYSVKGGVFDVLTESQGDMLIAENFETLRAIEIFKESEGVHIEPAAGVALATLQKAATYEQIEPKALVLLHITGGRWYEDKLNNSLLPVEPSLQLDEQAICAEKTLEVVAGLFRS